MTKLTHGNFEGNITIKNGEVPATPALKALKFMDKYFPQDSRNGESGEVIETIRTALKKSAQVDGLVTLLTEIRKWMDKDMGAWDVKFMAEIDKALQKFSATEI